MILFLNVNNIDTHTHIYIYTRINMYIYLSLSLFLFFLHTWIYGYLILIPKQIPSAVPDSLGDGYTLVCSPFDKLLRRLCKSMWSFFFLRISLDKPV